MVQYRVYGSTTWIDAQPLYRVDFEGYNMLAGSIFFLDDNTEYEVNLELSDPDGGAETRIETVSTKPVPLFPDDGNTSYVIPGVENEVLLNWDTNTVKPWNILSD